MSHVRLPARAAPRPAAIPSICWALRGAYRRVVSPNRLFDTVVRDSGGSSLKILKKSLSLGALARRPTSDLPA